ncbi:unnamed protein product [Polarella glacialis]|uniref:Uncharacterized protein n=1 Tax=Polarella glacialis TaxID=89957 RepID=A0A813L0A5_POLGL|nr:unnamed protein product [Polarella glacialis]
MWACRTSTVQSRNFHRWANQLQNFFAHLGDLLQMHLISRQRGRANKHNRNIHSNTRKLISHTDRHHTNSTNHRNGNSHMSTDNLRHNEHKPRQTVQQVQQLLSGLCRLG